MENNTLKLVVEGAVEKKGKDIVILDLKKFQTFTEYFVIVSGSSGKHVQAVADGVKEICKKGGAALFSEEGYKEAKWILLDYGDVILHIFDEEIREFYDIEGLWFEADKKTLESLGF